MSDDAESPEARVRRLEDERDKLARRCDLLGRELIESAFKGSGYVAGKLKIPVDLIHSGFRDRFLVDDDGKVRGRREDGDLVWSRSSPGEPAEFDEMLEGIINADPDRGMFSKDEVQAEAGPVDPHAEAIRTKRMTRRAWDAVADPLEKARLMREGVILVDDGAAAGPSGRFRPRLGPVRTEGRSRRGANSTRWARWTGRDSPWRPPRGRP